jgi:hypothetical protein
LTGEELWGEEFLRSSFAADRETIVLQDKCATTSCLASPFFRILSAHLDAIIAPIASEDSIKTASGPQLLTGEELWGEEFLRSSFAANRELIALQDKCAFPGTNDDSGSNNQTSLLLNIIFGALSMWAKPLGKLYLFLLFGSSLSVPVSAYGNTIHKDLTQNLISEVYSIGGEFFSFRQVALDEVKKANGNTDTYGFMIDWYHFDNEKLQQSSQKILDNLKSAETYLMKIPADGETARTEFGKALHTVQDFYAHSNWADIKTSSVAIHPDLGVRTLSDPPSGKKFCDATGGTFLTGITDITSGYFEFEFTLLGGTYCFPTPKDKCHHGFKGISSPPFCFSRPGINKDDTSRANYDRSYNQVRNIFLKCSLTPPSGHLIFDLS